MEFRNTLQTGRLLPIHSWDVFCMHRLELESINKKRHDRAFLQTFKDKYKWSVELDDLLSSEYDALVLTTKDVLIEWASAGFRNMTGYKPSEVKGQSPKILQGKNTSSDARAEISKQLKKQEGCKAELINYRKDGDAYICRVEIYPIFNDEKELTHFISLEQELA